MKNEVLTWMSLSHEERMKNPKVATKRCVSDLCPDKVVIRSIEEAIDKETGKVFLSVTEKVVDPRENFNKYRVTDFCIENLKASGAINMLKHTNLTGSVTDVADLADVMYGVLDGE